MPFIMRKVDNDFDACVVANAMADAGAVVVSFTYKGASLRIWAVVRDRAHIDQVEAMVNDALMGIQR